MYNRTIYQTLERNFVELVRSKAADEIVAALEQHLEAIPKESSLIDQPLQLYLLAAVPPQPVPVKLVRGLPLVVLSGFAIHYLIS